MQSYKAAFAWLTLAMAGAAFAHHSNTPFDMSRTLHTSGVVETANFKNPHSLLTLVIETENGSQAVTFEGHSLATLRHYGLLPSMVREGNTVSISYAPRRDDNPGGIFLSITTESGATLDFSHLGYD
ncbi:MAG TPA: DUF6152 family protein [Gammaproteobacteria bacterium]|nr:DUF6152 family protein [Gammaproteobacteria bacterium]